MNDFQKNLTGKLTTKQSRDQLRQKLKARIAAKKHARTNKVARKTQNNKVNLSSFRLNNNNDIRAVALSLMDDVGRLHQKGIINPVKRNGMLAKKYEFFLKNYFGIYMGIIKGELPLNILDMMLSQKSRIDNKEVSAEQASMAMGDIFAKRLNVDVDALVKSAEINKKNFKKE